MRRTLIAVCALVAVACTAQADLKEALDVTDVSTGWFDAGIVDGKNKLVPSISFRLRNSSEASVSALALNVVFRNIQTGEVNEEVFKQRVPLENKQTELLTVRSQTGHVGEPPQTRQEMLQNTHFQDMEAVIFVRQTSAQWVELHRVPVLRELLTR